MTNGTFTMPNVAVTCNFTNTRTTNAVSLKKNWVDGASPATPPKLTITGGTGATKTSTSNGDTGSWTDTAKQATSTRRYGHQRVGGRAARREQPRRLRHPDRGLHQPTRHRSR